MALKVAELAERTGISPDTLRYYGRLGLLAETGRTAAGHRYYDEAAVERLRFIRGAQWLDQSLGGIRELLEMLDGEGCPCGFSVALVRRRIAEIDAQRSRLDEMHAIEQILAFVDSGDEQRAALLAEKARIERWLAALCDH